ncbi:TPA: hypothetical protein QC364_003720 [Bacillus cereus]|nr:hypothetical protein [Bacillus cereus]
MKSPYDFYITPEEYSIAESNGIHRDLLNERVRGRGWDKEIAIVKPLKKHWTGWLEVKEIALQNGICYGTFKARRKKGMGKLEAATRPPLSKIEALQLANKANEPRRIFTTEEIRIAEENGIKYGSFRNRVQHLHWDIERAKTEPIVTASERGKMGRAASSWAETMYIPKAAQVQVYQAR